MSFVKGQISLTRYQLLNTPPDELTDEYLVERLNKNSFIDIEFAPEEKSLGWVEIFNHLSTNFDPAAFKFGDFLAFTIRLDTRKISAKTLNRYYAIKEAEYIAKTERKPNSLAKKELKESIRLELIRRSLLNTELMEVLWLKRKNEVWFAGTGEKKREIFEELWNRTFGLSLRMMVPISSAQKLLPQTFHKTLMESKPKSFWL